MLPYADASFCRILPCDTSIYPKKQRQFSFFSFAMRIKTSEQLGFY